MNKERRVIANTRSPLIEAVVTQGFRFADLSGAVAKIAFLKQHFITTPGLLPESPEDAVLWIKDYALEEAEREEGRTGNFAHVTWRETGCGKLTLAAEKLDVPLERHPQRKNLNHPDWGHYLLRRCRKGTRYDTLDAANDELRRMAETYPKACVLATNKLHVQVYRKKGEDESALEPMTLEIATAREGGFTITCAPNTYVPQRKTGGPKEEQGAFTAHILKRS